MRHIEVPQTLDDPPLALIFDAHQLGIVIGAMALGILIEQMIPMIVIGIIASKLFTRYSEGRPNGFVRHALYWRGIPLLSPRYPHAFDREYRP